MNFIEICRRVAQEGGVSGTIATVVNQTGEAGRIVGWVQDAYRDICINEPSQWNFLRRHFMVQLVANQGEYAFEELITQLPLEEQTKFASWALDTVRVGADPGMLDETFCESLQWPAFRNMWRFSSRRVTYSRPLNVSVDPQMRLVLGPIPDQAYWLDMEYVMRPEDLALDTDTPLFPERFHMLVVWKALVHYGMFEAAPEVVARAQKNYDSMLLRIDLDQTTGMAMVGALA